jgi:hypothetical protein
VTEVRLGALVRLRERDPRLDPVQSRATRPIVVGTALRVRDAVAGGHPVDGARLDALHRAEAVAMHERAVEEIGHRGEPDVRVGPDVDAGARRKLRRAHVVEEDEGPDHLLRMRRQEAPHFEAADVLGMGLQEGDGGHARALR